ncbi:hypothetical protein SLS60_006058 [Paraconiothyrium brasiliense]|uniref:Uncharacterized protein n=1 Tax=Paraconiothyrium brasiliense TaxID=300254 RepID=A0ABR3RE13_9PLEO
MVTQHKKGQFNLPGENTEDSHNVQIYIGWGDNHKKWKVSRELAFRSNRFRAQWQTMLKGAGIVHLEIPKEAGVEDTELYICFVQCRISNLSYKLSDNSAEATDRFYHDLARIYILSHSKKLNDKETRNDVVKAMVWVSQQKCDKGYSKPPPGQVVRDLYNHTSEGHEMRVLLVDIWTHVNHDQVEKDFEHFPKAFVMDLITSILQQPAVATSAFLKQLLVQSLKTSGGTDKIPRIVEAADPYLEE